VAEGSAQLVLSARHQSIAGSLSIDNRLSRASGPWKVALSLGGNSLLGFGEQVYGVGEASSLNEPRHLAQPLAGGREGLLTPARPWYGERGFVAAAQVAIDDFRHRTARDHDHHELLDPLARVAEARREAVAPVIRIEAALHPWVAYGIMPLFALANAGVDLRGVELRTPVASSIVYGVVAGLVLGKPAGVLAASFLAEQAGVAARPRGVTWRAVAWIGARWGGPHVRRAYGTAEMAVKYQEQFKRLSIRPMVNLAAGKNTFADADRFLTTAQRRSTRGGLAVCLGTAW
jgi:hypothetical protein